MSLKHGLLGLLEYGEMTGYELCKVFNDSLAFFWQATTSQVYRELSTMEKKGWLSSGEVIQSGKPNKKVYGITEEGRSELTQWLARDLKKSDVETRSAFLMKVFLSGRSDSRLAIENLRAFRDLHLQELSKLEKSEAIDTYRQDIKDNLIPLFWGLTARFGSEYYRMCIAWADESIRILTEVSQ